MNRNVTRPTASKEPQPSQLGQGLSEYGIILIIVAIALVAVVKLLEPAIEDLFVEFADDTALAPPSLVGYTPPPPPNSTPTSTPTLDVLLHVADIDDVSTDPTGGNWTASAAIRVQNGNSVDINNATVSARFNGVDPVTCTTNSQGWCSVSMSFGHNESPVTLRIESISRSTYIYAPAQNTDPEGDSDGTVIALRRP